MVSHVMFHLFGNLFWYMVPTTSHVSMAAGRQLATALVVCGTLFVVGMLGLSEGLIRRFTRKLMTLLAMPLEDLEEELQLLSRSSGQQTSSSSQSVSPLSRTLSNLPDGLEVHEYVGRGSFGRVFFCTWHGKKVAAKEMRWDAHRLGRVDPVREAKLSLKLSHGNLVQAYNFFHDTGADRTTQTILILQEWCDKGTLHRFCDVPRWHGDGLRYVKSIMSDVGHACNYLHSRDVIHADLTSNNVLLQTRALPVDGAVEFVAKVCDFGLSRVLDEGASELLTSQLGTVSHMPPELFEGSRSLSKSADIYAAGVLLYEVLLGEMPYKDSTVPQIIVSVSQGNGLQLPVGVPEVLRRVFEQCLSRSPDHRPSADALVSQFAEWTW